MKTQHKWLAEVGSIVLVIAVFIALFDWNSLRGFVERRVDAATGRELTIGHLDVKVRWHPRVILDDVTFTNANWASTPNMAQVKHAEVTLNLLSLLSKHIEIPLVRVSEPNIVLEQNEQGMNNWVFDQDNEAASDRTVALQDLDIDHGVLTFKSPLQKIDARVEISSEPDSDQTKRRLRVAATGTYHDLKTDAQGEIGEVTSLADLQHPYPVKLSGNIGKTRGRVQGTIGNPMRFEGLNGDFELSGGSLAELFPLVGVPLPSTPEYSFSGHLAQSGTLWDLQKFKGKVGNSDVQGNFSVDRSTLPQVIKADLVSNNLDLADLSGTVGARNEQGQSVQKQSDKLLPDTPFDFEKLHAANADVQFKGKRIKTERLPINDMATHLKLKDGVMVLDPLNFGVASGDITATVNLNANTSPIETDLDAKLKNIHFDQLFPGVKLQKANAGIIGGRAKLAAKGNSLAKMMGSANGQVAFMMDGGSVSELTLRLANLDVANSVVRLLGGDKSTPIRCMVGDLKATDGVMNIDTFVLDTNKSALKGDGHINFNDESLDVNLRAVPKDISLVALRGPIHITGTLKNPKPSPDLKNAGGRLALAAVLGSVAGPLAFIPLLEFGHGENSDCAALMHEAQESGKKEPEKPK